MADEQPIAQVGEARSKSKVEKKRSLRSRSYAIASLQIGTFFMDLSAQSMCSNKIRFYFTQEQVVYDFEFEFWVNAEAPSKFLAAICIPFGTISGICCKGRELYFLVSAPPRLVIGSNGLHPVPPPIGIDITDGQLQKASCHKVGLNRSQGYLIQQILKSCHPGFKFVEDISPSANAVSYNADNCDQTSRNGAIPTELEGEEESTETLYVEDSNEGH